MNKTLEPHLEPPDALDLEDPESTQPTYEDGWQEGFDICQKRYMDILGQFEWPELQNRIIRHLPLHPSQPDRVLEHTDWLHAQGQISAKRTS